MPKHLIRGSYTVEGVKGLLKEGGSKRVEAVKQLAEAVGGKVEGFYFGYGEDDFFIITDGADDVGVLAANLIAEATGTLKVRSAVLLTPEEVDEVAKISAPYRPPGQ